MVDLVMQCLIWARTIHIYNMANYSQSQSEHSDWFFRGLNFAVWTVSMDSVTCRVFFASETQKSRGASAIEQIYN